MGQTGRLGEPIVQRRSVEMERQFSAAFADAVLGKAPTASTSWARPVASANGIASAVAVAAPPTPSLGSTAPAAPASGRADKAHFWRHILADILEYLARKLR